jgi:hypothetical protein
MPRSSPVSTPPKLMESATRTSAGSRSSSWLMSCTWPGAVPMKTCLTNASTLSGPGRPATGKVAPRLSSSKSRAADHVTTVAPKPVNRCR